MSLQRLQSFFEIKETAVQGALKPRDKCYQTTWVMAVLKPRVLNHVGKFVNLFLQEVENVEITGIVRHGVVPFQNLVVIFREGFQSGRDETSSGRVLVETGEFDDEFVVDDFRLEYLLKMDILIRIFHSEKVPKIMEYPK